MAQFRGMPSKLRTDRFRGGRQWVEKRTNAWAFWIGVFTGWGYSSETIASRLADGDTHDATVRSMWQKWGWKSRNGDVYLQIPMTVRQRANVTARAAQRGLSPEEYCRRMLVCGSMPVDQYSQIVRDDQFEDVR
ncbi:MAG: hypothetical protein WD472_11380 [Dehalococcoidia bacterium]